MFDLGWTELLVIGIVALIVVGPKDLPGMFRTVGNFVGKAKKMAREFSRAMNEAADESGMGDVTKSLKAATNPVGTAMDEVKKSTEGFAAQTLAGHPPKRAEFDDERKEMAEKISQKSAEMAEERIAAEKAEAAKADKAKPSTKTSSTKAAPAAKTAPKKTAPKKSAEKKSAAPKSAAKKKPAAKAAKDKA